MRLLRYLLLPLFLVVLFGGWVRYRQTSEEAYDTSRALMEASNRRYQSAIQAREANEPTALEQARMLYSMERVHFAASRGHGRAMWRLTEAFWGRYETEAGIRAALAKLKAEAAGGDVESATMLGMVYLYGRPFYFQQASDHYVVKRDTAEARRLLLWAADHGNSRALISLGDFLAMMRETEAAKSIFQKGIAAGIGEAAYRMGGLYQRRYERPTEGQKPNPEDLITSFRYGRRAYEMGYAEAREKQSEMIQTLRTNAAGGNAEAKEYLRVLIEAGLVG